MIRRRECLSNALGLLGCSLWSNADCGSAHAEVQVPERDRTADEALREAPAVTLTCGALRARVLIPDSRRGFYRGTRFDWAGMISSLTLGEQQFYGAWFETIAQKVRDFQYGSNNVIVAGPNSAAVGPAEEFDWRDPPGFAQARAGDLFLKIGVGGLVKPDGGPYSNARDFRIAEPGRRDVDCTRSSVTFRHSVGDIGGYAYEYQKRVLLSSTGPALHIVHALCNTGSRSITTQVYNHNFLTFGGTGLSRGASITFPFPITVTPPLPGPAVPMKGNQIVLFPALKKRDSVAALINGFDGRRQHHRFVVEDLRSSASAEIIGDQPLTRLGLWSIRSVLAVEPFIQLTVRPGESVGWTQTTKFFAAGRDSKVG